MNQPRNNHDSNPYESAQQTTPQNPQLDATPNATQAPEISLPRIGNGQRQRSQSQRNRSASSTPGRTA